MEKKLTLKETRLVKEFVKSGNKTQSAIKAGYSKKTARQIAYETLTKPHIQEKIEQIMSDEATNLGMTVKFILEKLKAINDLNILEHEKLAPTILKSLEVVAKHLKMFPENTKVLDVRLSEHKAIIAELAKDE